MQTWKLPDSVDQEMMIPQTNPVTKEELDSNERASKNWPPLQEKGCTFRKSSPASFACSTPVGARPYLGSVPFSCV
jgi:hypothetical protein